MRPGLPPIPPPPARRRWVVPAAASVAAVAVGIGAGVALTRTGSDDVATPGLSPAPSTSASASASSSASPAAPPPPPSPAGPAAVLPGVAIAVPAGWRLEDAGAGQACITRAPGGCELRVVQPDVVRKAGIPIEDPRPEARNGWYLGTDVPGCDRGLATGRLVVRELRPVADKRAAYREWDVTCGGAPYRPARPRLWWLPKTRLAFLDESDDPAADAVIETMVRTAQLG